MDLIQPTQPPKDPVLILLMSLVAGIGYLMIGQKTKGIVAIVLWVVGGVLTCGSGAGLLSIVYAVDGYLQAKQLQAGFAVGEWTFFNDHR